MLASLSLSTTTIQHLKKIEYTGARVKHMTLYENGGKILDVSSPSFQELRKTIFRGIETPELLSGSFSCVSDKSNKGPSFRKYEDFCAWMCPDNYEYEDGESISLYIRNSSANEIMKDVLKALDQRLFKFGCHIGIVLNDESELCIKVGA